MKLIFKNLLLSAAFFSATSVFSQALPTVEMRKDPTVLPNSNYGFGTSASPIVTEFSNDEVNNNTFSTLSPRSTFTVSFKNQQFTNLNYGTSNYGGLGYSTLQTTGLVFGAGPTLSTDPQPQGAAPYNRYNLIGEYASSLGGPTNDMFTSNPNAVGAERGTGITVGNASSSKINGATQVFTTAQCLYNNPAFPIGSRAYFGDIVLKFSQPVKNPVIHLAGLGGCYRFLPLGLSDIPSNYKAAYFSTELELVNTGVTSLKLSGNQFMSVTGNNVLNSNNVNPNGGSTFDATETLNSFGAATGSVLITGTVQELVYRVYLKSGTGSQLAWSAPAFNAQNQPLINNAIRDPFAGDIWYVAASYAKPNQQVSGTVFFDTNNTAGNNNTDLISGSISTYIPATQVGLNSATSTAYANLLDASGVVVATTPIGFDGSYLFDEVPVGSYNVQLTTIQGVVGQPAPANQLPSGWNYTGEQLNLANGTDAVPNGLTVVFNLPLGENQTQVNFGVFNPSSLPVNLIKFSGVLNGNVANLEWKVADEYDMKGYELERSVNGTTFVKVAEKVATNNRLSQTYTHADNVATLPAKFYYRLKMLDIDGTFKYSNVVLMRKSGVKIGKVFPNPFVENIIVEVEASQTEKAQIRLLDNTGRAVLVQYEQLQKGGNRFDMNNLGRFANGNYIIEVTTSTEKITTKLQKN